MSSRAFNIADHMKNLQGTRTLASGAKIVGADADSIQAPGLITSAGGGDNTSLNTALNSATLGTGTTFPAGHVIQTSTPSVYTGPNSDVGGRSRVGSVDIWYHPESSMTNSITKIQGTSSFLLVHYHGTFVYSGTDNGAHGWVIFADGDNYYAVCDDFNRVNQAYSSGQHLPRLLSGSVPFLNMAAGSYTFTFGVARSSDSNMGIYRNYRINGDGINGSLCSSSMYIQEIAG